MQHERLAMPLRVSAPGKVLLTGGYLVLEERFAGLVVATSARFHTSISAKKHTANDPIAADTLLSIQVECPQFNQVLRAHAAFDLDHRVDLRMSEASDRNSYVEETLLCTLNGVYGVDRAAFAGVCESLRANGETLHILLEADNAFYSQVERLQRDGKAMSRCNLEELPAFLPPCLSDHSTSAVIAKTGLGSSAALVTSLVGAVAQFFLGHDLTEARLDLIHNLAQLSHCYVQRKIGSGFDVSSACYGTQRYSRFPPAVLNKFTSPESLLPAAIAACVLDNSLWRRAERVAPFSLPHNLHLLMGDVSTGSATVSMVKKVLAWQKSSPVESTRVVNALAQANAAVEDRFRSLFDLSVSASDLFIAKCTEMARVPANQWSHVDSVIGNNLFQLRSQYQRVRRSFREMGELAQVPIEPGEQSELLDATMEVPGVLIAGVPGAGGYDAIFVLTLDASALDRVEQLWLDWPRTHPNTVVCPLLCDVARSDASALAVEAI